MKISITRGIEVPIRVVTSFIHLFIRRVRKGHPDSLLYSCTRTDNIRFCTELAKRWKWKHPHIPQQTTSYFQFSV